MNDNNQRIVSVDNVRAFAIVTVVIGHGIILYSRDWNIYQTTQTAPLLCRIKELINLYQMQLFFSLSGFLFTNRTVKMKLIPFCQKKLKRIIVPFFSIGFLYMIPVKMIAGYPAYQGKNLLRIFWMFLCGSDTGHLWYLPTLFLFFLVAYCLSRLLGDHLITWLVTTAAGFGFWYLHNSFSLQRPFLYYVNWFLEFWWSFAFGAVLFHLSNWLGIKKAVLKTSGLLILLVLILFYSRILIISNLLVTAMILLAVYMLVPNQTCGVISQISRHSFGLYLFHSPLIYITFALFLNDDPWIVASINIILWGGAAFLFSSFLSRTKAHVLLGQ